MAKFLRVDVDFYHPPRFRVWCNKLKCHIKTLTETELSEFTFVVILETNRIISGNILKDKAIGYYIDDHKIGAVRFLIEFKEIYLIETK